MAGTNEKFCVREFPKKDLKVVDLLHYLDNKDLVRIIGDDGDHMIELYDDRVEYLTYTAEGCLHEAALYPLHGIEASNDGRIVLYVDTQSLNTENSEEG